MQPYVMICTFIFVLSQNHGVVEVGRDLLEAIWPKPLLKQGNLERGAQANVQVAFEDLQ